MAGIEAEAAEEDVEVRALAEGDLEPGASVALDRIAGRLGVSRTPVREALLRLETEGFVTIRPRSGISVRVLTREDIRNLYQMIGALEASVLVTERQNLTPERIADIMRDAGLEHVDWQGFMGGIVALHVGTVPLSEDVS